MGFDWFKKGFSSGIFVLGNELLAFVKSGKRFEQLSQCQLFEYLFFVALVTDAGSSLFMAHYSSLRDALQNENVYESNNSTNKMKQFHKFIT